MRRTVCPGGQSASSFDGTNDYALRGADLTGASDGQAWSASLWFNLNGGNAAVQSFFSGVGTEVFISRNASNQLDIFLRDTGGAVVYRRITTDTYTDATGWVNVLASANAATGVGQIYVNDAVPNLGMTTNPAASPTLDFTSTDWGFGARTSAAQKTNACITEFWMALEFIDFSVTANRRKFISSALKPVWLGANGQNPTGNIPIIYVPDGDPSTNKGSGGDFTVTGTLTACATTP